MKLFLSLATLLATASAFAPAPVTTSSSVSLNAANADLELIAKKCNPTIGFYDPLNLAQADFWGQSNEATVGFLRHAEIKHGRVAMAAFVGYCIQSNWHFPWAQTLSGGAFPSTDLSPEQQWDACPLGAKWQIFALISVLEVWDECGGGVMPHYMSGRQPGKYPSFKSFADQVHPVLNLYDPFGFYKKMSDEQKENRLIMEINNGRLAMLGIFGFLCADTIPGSVPALKDIAIPYEGKVMVPFEGQFSYF